MALMRQTFLSWIALKSREYLAGSHAGVQRKRLKRLLSGQEHGKKDWMSVFVWIDRSMNTLQIFLQLTIKQLHWLLKNNVVKQTYESWLKRNERIRTPL